MRFANSSVFLGFVLHCAGVGIQATWADGQMNHYCVRRVAGRTSPPAQECRTGWSRLGVGTNGCNHQEVSYLCGDPQFSGSDMIFRSNQQAGSAVRREIPPGSTVTYDTCSDRNSDQDRRTPRVWRDFRDFDDQGPQSCSRLTASRTCGSSRVNWRCTYSAASVTGDYHTRHNSWSGEFAFGSTDCLTPSTGVPSPARGPLQELTANAAQISDTAHETLPP